MKVALALTLFCPIIAFGQGRTIVVPNELEQCCGNVGNNALNFPSGNSARYQQVYAASQFTNSGPDGILITRLAFRVDDRDGRGFANTIPDIQINFSTTGKVPDSLSPVFADNIGGDEAVGYRRGPLSIRSGGQPALWDVLVPLTNPFYYNPAAGNLLMDVRNFSGGLTSPMDGAFTAGDSISLVYAYTGDGSGSVDSLSGVLSTSGLITLFEFTPVPEPGTYWLVGLGLAALALVHWKRKQMRTL